MAKGKTPGYDEIPIEFFQQLWLALDYDCNRMVIRGIEEMAFHEGVIKRLISLIPKEGDLRILSTSG